MPYQGPIFARLGDQRTERPLNLLCSGADCNLVRYHPLALVYSFHGVKEEEQFTAPHNTGALVELTYFE
jgi:hypothetical protein